MQTAKLIICCSATNQDSVAGILLHMHGAARGRVSEDATGHRQPHHDRSTSGRKVSCKVCCVEIHIVVSAVEARCVVDTIGTKHRVKCGS